MTERLNDENQKAGKEVHPLLFRAFPGLVNA
jgi:hypothetical protein